MNTSYCYWVDIPPVEVSDVVDIIQITPRAGTTVRVQSIILGQVNDPVPTDDEQLQIAWLRGFTTSGDDGEATSPTPRPCIDETQGAGFGVQVFNTTIATGNSQQGPKHIVNTKAGIERPYTLEEVFDSKGILVLRLLVQPTIAYTLTGSVLIEEVIG